jgi:hypothetical protein
VHPVPLTAQAADLDLVAGELGGRVEDEGPDAVPNIEDQVLGMNSIKMMLRQRVHLPSLQRQTRSGAPYDEIRKIC